MWSPGRRHQSWFGELLSGGRQVCGHLAEGRSRIASVNGLIAVLMLIGGPYCGYPYDKSPST